MGIASRTVFESSNKWLSNHILRSLAIKRVVFLATKNKKISFAALAALVTSLGGVFAWQLAGADASLGQTLSVNTPASNEQNGDVSITAKPSDSNVPTDNSNNAKVSGSPADINVSINGQPIPVSADGSVHKVVPSANGTTKVDITTQNNNSASGGNKLHTSTNITVNSNSHSSVGQNAEGGNGN